MDIDVGLRRGRICGVGEDVGRDEDIDLQARHLQANQRASCGGSALNWIWFTEKSLPE